MTKMTHQYLNLYKAYTDFCNQVFIVNASTKNKLRKPNFPECISEYVVKCVVKGLSKGKSGDLVYNSKKVEVKCFSSSGPSSFGPEEHWDYIIFVDAIHHPNITLYLSKEKDTSTIWKNLKISKTETFDEQRIQKRRPRMSFSEISKQIPFETIFTGSIIDILSQENENKNKYLLEQEMITFADFFCGIGGFRIGFEKASKDFKCVFSNDIDKNAISTYEKNFDKVCPISISDLDIPSLPDFDILTAGFPCQPFSIAGKQNGFSDERGNLFFDIIKILKVKKPKVVFLENVKNLQSHDNGDTFKVMLKELKKSGYHVKHEILNATDFGLPQNRERIFILGFLDKNLYNLFTFDDLTKTKCNKNLSEFLEEKILEKYYYTPEKSLYEKLLNDVTKNIQDNVVYQYRRYYIRENKKGVFPTLTANMGSGGHNVPIIKDKNGIRKITPRECLNLQGFPKEYKTSLSDVHIYKQAGNSVAVPVIKSIAKKLRKIMELQKNIDIPYDWTNTSLIQFLEDGNYPSSYLEFFHSDKIQKILINISENLSKEKDTIYPSITNVFRAFYLTRLEDIRLVIVGQDPYHDGNATGICFSVPSGRDINPSLRNIFTELGLQSRIKEKNGNLNSWAKQGCLMINTSLTVAKNDPESHVSYWVDFTEELIKYIAKKGVVWLLMGKHAISYEKIITDKKSMVSLPLVFKTSHPSPLSAHKMCQGNVAFLGSGVFEKINNVLKKKIIF